SVVQGGSTITQQLAKNLFLSNERTIERKIKEAFLSLWLESHYPKKEILKLYLDRAYMGGGTFGVAAASEYYFDKSARDVSLAEAAMLAGLFKAPAKYAPHINLPAARARANEVLTNMVQAGFMTEGQVAAARREPADVVLRENVESPDYFLDWVFDEVKEAASQFDTRSLVVRTTIDLGFQKAAEESLEFHLRQFGDEYKVTQGAIVLVENNGAVRAIVGGRDYGESQFNRATRALRQAGSSFKPYVYAAALATGLTPDTKVSDRPVTWRGWSPQNYARRYSGSVTLTSALARSINTVPVYLARDVIKGTEPIVELAHAMGVESEMTRHHTMVLGTSSITVMDQATAYLCFANGGIGNTRHGFTQIMSSGGRMLFDRRKEPAATTRVMEEKVAFEMNQMLAQVPAWGTGQRARLTMTTAAGKTGTTQSYRDAWFVGYTGNFTAAVWFGNDDYTTTNELTGGRLPAMTWQRLLSYAHTGIELKPLPGVENSIPELPEKGSADNENNADTVAEVEERPRTLSAAMSDFLTELHDAFVDSAPLNVVAPVADLNATSAISN
ncbi:MAG TPA: PBP1A family penicillin-binding protein, partial [Rhizobiaceae bacterium]|nr:PBP1A family penicillin-binding protein [Rhizobiaceae bacterium]